MTVEFECHRIAGQVYGYAARTPSMTLSTRQEIGEMLSFLWWAADVMPAVSVRDGGELFRLYAMHNDALKN